MVIVTLQQIIDERISFLIEQINPNNKPEVNTTFQFQIDAIRFAADDVEKVESIIMQKKTLLKNSKDMYESDRLFAELEALEWLQAQIVFLLLKTTVNQLLDSTSCCSICGKKLKFSRTSENPLACWQCMVVNVDS
jgi:hypothetical protein